MPVNQFSPTLAQKTWSGGKKDPFLVEKCVVVKFGVFFELIFYIRVSF